MSAIIARWAIFATTLAAVAACQGQATVSLVNAPSGGDFGTGNPQTLTFRLDDSGGANAIQFANIIVNNQYNSETGCHMYFNPQYNTLYFYPKWGNATPVTLGQGSPVVGEHCILDSANSSVSFSGNGFTLNLRITLQPSAIGTQGIYVVAVDNSGSWNSNYSLPMANWTVRSEASTQPPTVVVHPLSGSGSQAVHYTITDPNGSNYITSAGAGIAMTGSPYSNCQVNLDVPSGWVTVYEYSGVTQTSTFAGSGYLGSPGYDATTGNSANTIGINGLCHFNVAASSISPTQSGDPNSAGANYPGNFTSLEVYLVWTVDAGMGSPVTATFGAQDVMYRYGNAQATWTISGAAVSVAPASLSFTAVSGSSIASQTLAISNSGGGTLNWTATPTTTNGGNWLQLGAASGTAPSNLTVLIPTATEPAPGTYSGSINVSSTSSSQTVPVTLTIYPAPSVSPTSLTFYGGGGIYQPITLTSSPTFPWTASSDSSWITFNSSTSGTGPGTVIPNVAVNNSGSSRTGHITIAGLTVTVTQSAMVASVVPTAVLQNVPSGNILSPTAQQTLVFRFDDPNGPGALGYAFITINNNDTPSNGCALQFIPQYNQLYVLSGGVNTSYTLGQGQATGNHCNLDISNTTAVYSGTGLTLTVPVTLRLSAIGTQNVYVQLEDTNWNLNAAWWNSLASWTLYNEVDQNSPTIALQALANNAPTQTLRFAIKNDNGYLYNTEFWATITQTATGNYCYLQLDLGSGYLYVFSSINGNFSFGGLLYLGNGASPYNATAPGVCSVLGNGTSFGPNPNPGADPNVAGYPGSYKELDLTLVVSMDSGFAASPLMVNSYAYDVMNRTGSNQSFWGPPFTLSPSALNFSSILGGNAGSQNIAITNNTGTPLNWTASTTGSWLSAPSSGASSSLTANVNSASLPAAVYNGAGVTVSALGTSLTVPATLTINNPAPALNATTPLSPATTATGAVGFQLNVYGSGFIQGSTVQWNGSPRSTSFLSTNQLTATINAADVATAGTFNVTVVNSSPGGGSASAPFSVVTPTYTISGLVEAIAPGTNTTYIVPGVDVKAYANGVQVGTTSNTLSVGSYSFAGLPKGGTYTIIPSKNGYTFNPPSITFNNLGSDQPNENLYAATVTIMGSVTGITDPTTVTVSLTGSKTQTLSADNQGNFSFVVPVGGNYTVTPAKALYLFTPPEAAYPNLTATQLPSFQPFSGKSAQFTDPDGGSPFSPKTTGTTAITITASTVTSIHQTVQDYITTWAYCPRIEAVLQQGRGTILQNADITAGATNTADPTTCGQDTGITTATRTLTAPVAVNNAYTAQTRHSVVTFWGLFNCNGGVVNGVCQGAVFLQDLDFWGYSVLGVTSSTGGTFSSAAGISTQVNFEPGPPDTPYQTGNLQSYYLGSTTVASNTNLPRINGRGLTVFDGGGNPVGGAMRGTSGAATIYGTDLTNVWGSTTVTIDGNGVTDNITYPAAGQQSPTQLNINYQVASSANTGYHNLNVSNIFGNTNCPASSPNSSCTSASFYVADPPPTISSVTPDPIMGSTLPVPFTIQGSGFGSNPSLSISGLSGVSLNSAPCTTLAGAGPGCDTTIAGTVNADPNVTGTATITVGSNGFGNSFQQTQPSESRIYSYAIGVTACTSTVQIQARPGGILIMPSTIAGQYSATLTASGLPQGGVYTWSTDNTAMLGFSPATGPGANQTTARIASTGAHATITVTYLSPCGKSSTDSFTFALSDDVTVIFWVDGNTAGEQILSLPPVLNSSDNTSALPSDLDNPLFCPGKLTSWIGNGQLGLGRADNGYTDVEVEYANLFLLRNSGNTPPLTFPNLAAMVSSKQYRAYNRYQASYEISGGSIDPTTVRDLQRAAVLGKTPEPCSGVVVPIYSSPAIPHGNNDIVMTTPTRDIAFHLNEGRLGSLGQAVNQYLNGKSGQPFESATPWIWSAIQFNASGTTVPLAPLPASSPCNTCNAQIYSSIQVYKGTSPTQSIDQAANVFLFFSFDSTSQYRTPQ